MEKLLVPRLWLDGWMEVEQGPARDRDKKNQFDDDSFGTQPASRSSEESARGKRAKNVSRGGEEEDGMVEYQQQQQQQHLTIRMEHEL